jgi:hypothetical protein
MVSVGCDVPPAPVAPEHAVVRQMPTEEQVVAGKMAALFGDNGPAVVSADGGVDATVMASAPDGVATPPSGAPTVTPTMTPGTPVILGSLDPEIIRRIVREHAGQIRYCYESELSRTPGIYGKIIMKWVINGEGKVMQATTAETQMKNANVESCLASRIKGWVFPKPKGGGIVIVNYPFVFKQSG